MEPKPIKRRAKHLSKLVVIDAFGELFNNPNYKDGDFRGDCLGTYILQKKLAKFPTGVQLWQAYHYNTDGTADLEKGLQNVWVYPFPDAYHAKPKPFKESRGRKPKIPKGLQFPSELVVPRENYPNMSDELFQTMKFHLTGCTTEKQALALFQVVDLIAVKANKAGVKL